MNTRLIYPCFYAKCAKYDYVASSGAGSSCRVLEGVPPGCTPVPGASIIDWERRSSLSYSRREGFCVVEEPVKAVLPERVCELFDDIIAGKPRSAVLVGPGGTGKTLTLDIIRETAPFNVLEFESEMLLRPYVGQSEEELYRLLTQAEDSEPALLVGDEIDILVMSRGAATAHSVATGSGTAGISQNLVRIMLRRLQRWYNERRLLGLVGATNLPVSALEKPLLRAGRLGEPIYFPLPDRKALELLEKLYDTKIPDDVKKEILRQGLPHSNVIEYIKTGKLKKLSQEPFMGIEYVDVEAEKVLKPEPSARIVIAEKPVLALKLAALIAAVEYEKPLVYVRDPNRFMDAVWAGETLGFPLAIPYDSRIAGTAVLQTLDYPSAVFFLGPNWPLEYRRLSLENIAGIYGKAAVATAVCGRRNGRVYNLATVIEECLSGVGGNA